MKKIEKIFKIYTVKDLIRIIDRKFGLGAIEKLFASNWFNPFYTLYLNLRSFPLNQAIRLPLFVYGLPHFYCLSGRMLVEGSIITGMIKFNKTMSGAPSNMAVPSEINNQGIIVFKGRGFIGTGNKIFVAFKGKLEIGENFKITDWCNIGCFTSVKIGAQSRITHRCQLLDSNYHYVADFEKGVVPYHSHPISIGNGCWICNSSTVSGGTILPDFTIVASNSLVNKDYSTFPTDSMIGGVPAKLIKTGLRKIENSMVEKKIIDYYRSHPSDIYKIPFQDNSDLYSFVDHFK